MEDVIKGIIFAFDGFLCMPRSALQVISGAFELLLLLALLPFVTTRKFPVV